MRYGVHANGAQDPDVQQNGAADPGEHETTRLLSMGRDALKGYQSATQQPAREELP